jgi:putative Mg2+ transporter-C (MgtC) family protein
MDLASGSNMLMFVQVLLAFLLGAVIGLEREFHQSAAGIRTYAAVCLGSCVFSLMSQHAGPGSDPSRIAAQIASGVGFLGAGVIFRDGANTSGLTTAATIWATAAVGMSVAFHFYLVSVLTTILIVFMLSMTYIPFYRKMKRRKKLK